MSSLVATYSSHMCCTISSLSGILIEDDMSLDLLCEVPFDVSFFVKCDFDGLAKWMRLPMAGAVACVSVFFRVHVFISNFLSSGNVVIARMLFCKSWHRLHSCWTDQFPFLIVSKSS